MAGAKILYGVEKALENFLHTICEDYSLNYDELYERYFLPKGDERTEAESSELPEGIPEGSKMTNKTKPKPKAKRTASNGSVATNATNRKMCCALTTKKTPCKKFAIDGTDFCSCHSNGVAKSVTISTAANPASSDMDDDATSSKKKKKTTGKGKGKAKSPQPVIQEPVSEGSDMDSDNEASTSKSKSKASKKKDSFPVHTHPVDYDDTHEDCALCSDSGNSMSQDNNNGNDDEFEIEDAVKTRLANILASIEEDDGSETEDE